LRGQQQFILYSRRGCHLCDELLEELEPLCRGRLEICVRDVDTSPEWLERYGLLVPVLYYGESEVCRYRMDREAVLEVLNGTA
jgi:hypothetical protein